MSAPLRIHKVGTSSDAGAASPIKDYSERLVKLIPAEIIALYLAGKSAIVGFYPKGGTPSQKLMLSEGGAWLLWSCVCLVAVVLFRRWATSDVNNGIPPERGAVAIAAGSFVVWVYSFGDVFDVALGLWDPLIATFLVLAWTFVIPAFYGQRG